MEKEKKDSRVTSTKCCIMISISFYQTRKPILYRRNKETRDESKKKKKNVKQSPTRTQVRQWTKKNNYIRYSRRFALLALSVSTQNTGDFVAIFLLSFLSPKFPHRITPETLVYHQAQDRAEWIDSEPTIEWSLSWSERPTNWTTSSSDKTYPIDFCSKGLHNLRKDYF